jgi:hypothetical protein
MAMSLIVYVWEGLVQRGRAHKRGPQNPKQKTSNTLVNHRQKHDPTSSKHVINNHQNKWSNIVKERGQQMSNKVVKLHQNMWSNILKTCCPTLQKMIKHR